jgi:hypothetical protein
VVVALVLDDHPLRAVQEVHLAEEAALIVEQRGVHLGLGKAGFDEQTPQPPLAR